MDKHLHIVTHEIPWPVDYGGVVDLFYKIKALHSFGIKIHLHCFTKRDDRPAILENYCQSVQYYQRATGLASVSLNLPYIVKSRSDEQLLKDLQKDEYPVLLEGIHCTFLLYSGQLSHRKVFIRLHNVETSYYRQLARNERSVWRRLFFLRESALLHKYERKLAPTGNYWAVSATDEEYYRKEFSPMHIQYLPVFLPWSENASREGTGDYALYHGNLSVNENEMAAIWLIEKVFSKMDTSLVIAGKTPSSKLVTTVGKYKNVSLVADPAESRMQELIENAHINVLPSFNSTGIKLKLLNALYNGRHCLVNKAGVSGSGLEDCCEIASTAIQFREAMARLNQQQFTPAMIAERVAQLRSLYDWEKNTRKIIAWIY